MLTLFVLLTAATGEAPDMTGYYIFMGTFTLFVGIFTPLLVWAIRTIKQGSYLTSSVKEGQAIRLTKRIATCGMKPCTG